MLKIGFDGGYGNTEVVTSTGYKIEIPSIVGNGFKREFGSLFGNDDSLSLENIHVQIDGNDYFVGKLAQEASLTASSAFDKNKISHSNNRIIIAATTAFVMSKERENMIIVSCLPYSDFSEQKEEYKKYLENFKVEVILYDGSKEIYREVKFNHAAVFVQGAAAVYPILKYYEEYFKTEKIIAIADIGMKTLDVVVVKIGKEIRILENLSFGLNTGIFLIHEFLSKAAQERLGESLSTPELDSIIRNNGIWMDMDFSEALDKGRKELKRMISDEISKRWESKKRLISKLFLVGGGGEFMFNEFKQIRNDVQLVPNPRFANAEGCLTVANVIEELIHEQGIAEIR